MRRYEECKACYTSALNLRICMQQKRGAITLENGSSYGTIIAIVRKTDKYLRFPQNLFSQCILRMHATPSHAPHSQEFNINKNANNHNNGTCEIRANAAMADRRQRERNNKRRDEDFLRFSRSFCRMRGIIISPISRDAQR